VSWDPRTGYAREATSLMGPAAADAANPEASARAFLGAYADLFGIADQQRTLRAAAVSVTRASGERGGITSRIVRFAQVLADLPVHEGEVVVHLTPSSRVLTVFNRYQPGLVPAGAFKLSRDEAIAKARERWKPRKEVSATVASQVIFPVGSEGRRAWRVALDGAVTIVDANTGEILLARDESRRNNTASVFKENNVADSNTPTTLPIANLDGSGMLTGTRFQITNAAAAAQETSSTSDFLLGPGDPHFDDQMLYFHLETMADFFGGLGAPKPAGQTTVRSNVDSEILGQCNAAFIPDSHRILFAPATSSGCSAGCRSPAQYADAICHEYTHLVLADALGITGQGDETGALHEGTADYFSSTHLGNGCLGEGFTGKTCFRDLTVFKRYPDDMDTSSNEPHSSGGVWGSTLWALRTQIGAGTTDRLLIEGLRGLPGDVSFTQVAGNMVTKGGAFYLNLLDDDAWLNVFRLIALQASVESLKKIFCEHGIAVPYGPFTDMTITAGPGSNINQTVSAPAGQAVDKSRGCRGGFDILAPDAGQLKYFQDNKSNLSGYAETLTNNGLNVSFGAPGGCGGNTISLTYRLYHAPPAQ